MKRYLLGLLIVAAFSLGASGQQCSPLPCIVASTSLTGQSAALPLTTIYTPPASGLFRVSAYLSVSKVRNFSPMWVLNVGWADDYGQRKTIMSAAQSSSNGATIVVQAVGGQPLAYYTKLDGESGGSTYNLFIVVEQLQ